MLKVSCAVRCLECCVICTAYIFTGLADGNLQMEIKKSDDQNNSLVSSSPERPQSPVSPTDRTIGNKVSNSCLCRCVI